MVSDAVIADLINKFTPQLLGDKDRHAIHVLNT